ncbi:NAD(P)/FAD-dependent oxidoreductase [Pseudogemmobacter sonorensis]|uniref:NAD(P)/FAD-dependent oxidoreductase n=1 Tax=Pseudogemmobacter sonorensis TaxID=2989681 RepID=UPI0036CCA84C
MKIAGLNPFRRSRRLSEQPGPFTDDRYRGPLPEACDVAVLGGGIAGLTAAIELAKRGQKVVLLEKGRLGAEQTSRALGWAASLGDDGLRLPLSLRSKALWRDYQQNYGVDTSYRASGLVILCSAPDEMDMMQSWRDMAAGHGDVDARPLSLAQITQHMPAMQIPGLVGAWAQPSDACVAPEKVAPTLALIAAGLGVRIIENCAALGLDLSAGRVSGLQTEAGGIRTGAALVAGGAWSRRFLRQHGVGISQLPISSSLFRTQPMSTTLPSTGATGSFGWTRRDDGSLTFGSNSGVASITTDSLRLLRQFLPALRKDHGTLSLRLDADFFTSVCDELAGPRARQAAYTESRILGAVPDMHAAERALLALRRELPDFADARIETAWAGVIDATPDKAPIIGETGLPGLFVSTGFSAHGLAMAPAAAEIVAMQITGKTVSGAANYSNNRFARAAARRRHMAL